MVFIQYLLYAKHFYMLPHLMPTTPPGNMCHCSHHGEGNRLREVEQLAHYFLFAKEWSQYLDPLLSHCWRAVLLTRSDPAPPLQVQAWCSLLSGQSEREQCRRTPAHCKCTVNGSVIARASGNQSSFFPSEKGPESRLPGRYGVLEDGHVGQGLSPSSATDQLGKSSNLWVLFSFVQGQDCSGMIIFQFYLMIGFVFVF